MKKSTKKPIKKVSSKKPAINHLQPIDDILDFIELNEIKLKNLLESIPAKLGKLVTAAKTKVSKTIEQHKKASTAHKTMLTKHKAKPSKLTQAAVKKAEQTLSDMTKLVESIKNEHAELQAQLLSCKEMKKIFSAQDKLTAKKSNVKKSAKKKAVIKKEKIMTGKKPEITPLAQTVTSKKV